LNSRAEAYCRGTAAKQRGLDARRHKINRQSFPNFHNANCTYADERTRSHAAHLDLGSHATRVINNNDRHFHRGVQRMISLTKKLKKRRFPWHRCIMSGVIFGAGYSVVCTAATERDQIDWSTHLEDLRTTWTTWGGNLYNTRSSFDERRISPENAAKLHTKWVFTTAGDVSATPTVQGDSVYAVDWGGGVYRINAHTGSAVWARQMPQITGNATSFSRTSPAIADDRIIIGDQSSGTVFALDRSNGAVLWKTVVDPLPAAFITNSPTISRGVVYIGVSSAEEGLAQSDATYVLKFRGSVQALDLSSGAVLWKTYTVPSGYTGGAVWGSSLIIDHKRNALVATVGNNYSVPNTVSSCLKSAKTVEEQLVCLSPEDYIDGVLSLNLQDGAVRWGRRLQGGDTWTVSCLLGGGLPCPDPAGPDYDLGAGANLITLGEAGGRDSDNDHGRQIIGAGQKSGIYWGLNPDTGAILYGTHVGPGGVYGGIEWGTATDNRRVYVPIENFFHHEYTLKPTGEKWNGGSWAALNPANGKVLWQVKVPGNDPHHPALPAGALAPVSEANGVMYGGAMSGYMVALDAGSGRTLWKFQSGGSVVCGPAIVDGTVYWGSGYANDPTVLGGKGNNKLYAFTVADGDSGD
jgi:polyvinyl alcohol dehydrogenase (cytochrome)